MFCLNCGHNSIKVIDSRDADDWKAIRRRRECENCHVRFTTYEKMEIINLIVNKIWNKKEKYDRKKIENSFFKAITRRNISVNFINDIIRKLEFEWNSRWWEVSSKDIWKDILKTLKEIDEIAFIRYAIIHLDFKWKDDFIKFINKSL